MSSASNTPPEDYFNDLSRPTGNDGQANRQKSPGSEERPAGQNASATDSTVPKPKRIACIICRKRKLKCDGSKPSCSTCTRLGHDCAYDEVRRKSGPKRGYVKALEERLKQVETLLKSQDTTVTVPENTTGLGIPPVPATDFSMSNAPLNIANDINPDRWRLHDDSPQQPMDDLTFSTTMNLDMGLGDNSFTWEMISLGVEEPLPPQDTIDALHQVYFDKIHPSLPIIHKYRYLAAMNLAPNQRPPVTLRYAMWTLAASVAEKYMDLKEHFYLRSRKYMEVDILKGHGENMISISHAQTHILLASYEFKMMYFPRAWMSTGAAVRMVQMMGLHRLDGAGLDVKQCIPPPRDWTEREERRRTFWMAFAEDRYASIGTGWPMTIDERDVMTDLPASEEAFEMSKPEKTQSLADAFVPSGASKLSSFAGVILMAALFGKNLIHLHRPDADDRDNDLNGEFWKRHRNMDNILLNTSLSMPSQFKLPNGLNNPNIVFTNMNIHTSAICLHQAAIYKAEKNALPLSVSAESKIRCITAANEISNIMRMISHLDLSSMNPFISFCLYVAARVYVQYLKSKPNDGQTADSLRFLLSAMNALKKKNPLTESFMVQLDVDLENLGLRHPKYKSIFAYSEDSLGLATAKGKQIGARPLQGYPRQWSNECNYLRLREEIPEMDPATPPDAAARSSESQRSVDSTLKTTFDGDAPNWVPLEHPALAPEQEVQRTMQGLVLGQMVGSAFKPGELSNSGYINSESSNGPDSGLSPDTGNSSSNRPTPNSSTSSDTRPNLQSGRTHSGHASFETSPSMSNQTRLPDSRNIPNFFGTQTDYNNIPSTGLTPDNTFTMPETPGRDFPLPNGWEMSQQQTGLTPVGEGVFRHLMGLGGMDPMDMGWEGSS
ncbi:hypothetical protein B7463_g324, partial [Scytalidium lignicola]